MMEISQVQMLVVFIGFVSICFMAIIGYAGYVQGYGAALRDMKKDREELGLPPYPEPPSEKAIRG